MGSPPPRTVSAANRVAVEARPRRRLGILAPLVVLALCAAWATGSAVFALPPMELLKQLTRVVATPVYAMIYHADLARVEAITSRYRVGYTGDPTSSPPLATWHDLEARIPELRVIETREASLPSSPFVYEPSDSPYLQAFRARYRLDDIIRGAPDEYSAMLRLGAWLGTRWDHGTDPLVGTSQVCDPSAVVAAGEHGAKYWCEIAARTMVHAATAMGWSARVVTASRDGYTWEHAVAELWSNQFNKWFVLDPDFNVVYESSGIPLSAFELSHNGPTLQRAGRLNVRAIAPPKPSLPPHDVLPFYRYIHIDMRNDWCTRPLRPGSPAGGDRATWWTARAPFNPPLLTAKTHVEDGATFNWKVNSVSIRGSEAHWLPTGRLAIGLALQAYSPHFAYFEISADGGPWNRVEGTRYDMQLETGAHMIEARVVTTSGNRGPVAFVKFELASHRPPAVDAARLVGGGASPTC